jgi:hypothetical protein
MAGINEDVAQLNFCGHWLAQTARVSPITGNLAFHSESHDADINNPSPGVEPAAGRLFFKLENRITA